MNVQQGRIQQNVHRAVGTTAKRPDLADYRTPPIVRQWYVAGYREDFGEELKSITLLKRSLVTFRTSDGEPIVMQNRCAHRSFPLAKSWREGDSIRCRYHGAKYNSEGQMIDLPSQSACPRVSIRKYPAREIGPFVWVWLAPCPPDEDKLPKLRFGNPSEWAVATGYRHVPSSAFFMVENLMDITHIPFLHKDTLNFPQEFARTKFKMSVQGEEIFFDREINNRFYHKTLFFPKETGDKIDPYEYSVESTAKWASTAWTQGCISLNLKDIDNKTDDGVLPEYTMVIAHFLTPETDGTCHYWWCVARNYDILNSGFTAEVEPKIVCAFEEDMETCAYLQDMVDHDCHEFKEVLFTADKLSVTMRRIVQRQADAESDLFGADATDY